MRLQDEGTEQFRIDNEACRLCGLPYMEHDGREEHRFQGSGRQYSPDVVVTPQAQIREAERNARERRMQKEQEREASIRAALKRDWIDAPTPKALVRFDSTGGALRGEVHHAVAFRPSLDAWVAEVMYDGASRSRQAVLKRALGGWEEVRDGQD